MRKTLVVLSGGQDSTTCLYWALEKFDKVKAITFDYDQKHRRELDAAQKVSSEVGVDWSLVTIGAILEGTSPLINRSSELEQYEHHSKLPGGLEKTFVPARNLLFLTLAANIAYCDGITNIVTGVCQEDYGGYPDCRDKFIISLQQTLNFALYADNDEENFMRIYCPLMHLTKKESIDLAVRLKGCYKALAYTHTSYDDAYPPTGRDHATLLRQKGFEEAGLPDPLVMRAVAEGLIKLPDTKNYSDDGIKKYNEICDG
jgi:7-cyano-7-deazaguanine synthase